MIGLWFHNTTFIFINYLFCWSGGTEICQKNGKHGIYQHCKYAALSLLSPLSLCFQCYISFNHRQANYLLIKNGLSSSLIMPNPFPWKLAWQSLPIRVPAHPTSLSCWTGRTSSTIMLWSCSTPCHVRISSTFWMAILLGFFSFLQLRMALQLATPFQEILVLATPSISSEVHNMDTAEVPANFAPVVLHLESYF